ncbi:hypothetical protein AUEXF2481DRAFT_346079 [Aureobasidium subglaciale EXF-2481]|uniref:Methyltransferase domain-containing protein n=1 Tax=Aureobasidium subglaciale (strain EXF-2481) TaxID=1043005 RepID=A0A074YAM6_AURSE|nr:uncharacterized protein AUEXF2481DRAFT_346079 [Aureobasidium subglaciale EXF-2481]KEQ93019.1 hypothetical protein AUEXF2481DRAFT_346079 [Aureobasidium subglaciale EXF-2481]
MPPTPPSFGDLQYWNTRFSKEDEFEWLADFTALEPWLRRAIGSSGDENERERDGKGKRVLHIGCGTSALSAALKELVKSPRQIHNVDYSDVVIERQRQRDLTNTGEEASKWSTLDLLSLAQVEEFKKQGRYDVIIDKSTSDAISCAEDVHVGLPYHMNTAMEQGSSLAISGHTQVYPLVILAIHLAYLATPGCQWMVLSYSASRFSYWEDESPQRLPHPTQLWKMVRHEKIEQPQDPKDTVHRPPTMHHLYILERTETPLG